MGIGRKKAGELSEGEREGEGKGEANPSPPQFSLGSLCPPNSFSHTPTSGRLHRLIDGLMTKKHLALGFYLFSQRLTTC